MKVKALHFQELLGKIEMSPGFPQIIFQYKGQLLSSPSAE